MFCRDILAEPAHAMEESAKQSWFAAFMYWVGRPAYFVARITVPMATKQEAGLHLWDWRFVVLCTVTGPVLFGFAFELLDAEVNDVPIFPFVELLFVAIAIFLYFKLRHDHERPRFVRFFLFIGFLVSVSWFELFATELVNLLATLGVVAGLSQELLGLSILAWGNSVAGAI